jgi:peptidyl-prolyl cis-trans isomerase D
MLNALRNSVGSIGAKILLGLLVLAFAAWGIEGVFAARTQTVVATVGDAEIEVQEFSRTFDGRLAALRRTTGSNITAEDARRSGFDRIVLEQMATQTALSEEAKALGLDASDTAVSAAIMDFPQFRDAYGKFDRTAYDASLRQNRLRQNEFEENIRKDLARDALLQSIGNGTTAPRALAETLYKYRNEKRSFTYIALSPADVEDPGEPTDEALSTFHQENAARFTAPEFRKISFVALTVKDVASRLERTDQELLETYNARIDSYTTPERRRVEQIVFDTEEEAKEAAKKIADGEPFAKLAEARGLSAQDVSLGTQSKDDLPGNLAEAAFAPDEPGLVDPVGTALGWSLLNIRSIEPEKVVTFEEAKEALRTELTTTEARQVVPERSVDLDDQLAGGATLKEAAEQANARYAEVAAVDATGRDPNGDRVAELPDDPEFLAQVFATRVGDEPTLIEGTTGDYFSLSVEEITEAALRPLDTIKEEVAGAWEVAEREKALEVLAKNLVDRLEDGANLVELAEGNEAEIKTAGPGTRSDRSLGLSADLLDTLFDAELNEAAQGMSSDGLTRLIGRVAEIDSATGEDDVAAIDRSTEAYAARLAQDFVDQFTRTARERHPIAVNAQAIDAVFTAPHGGLGY